MTQETQSPRRWIKHHEFWSPRLYEFPFYLYLAWQCLRHRIGIADLAKANYCLDHGEIGIGSKFHTQNQFPQQAFLATDLLVASLPADDKAECIKQFAKIWGYPIILKPDNGLVGKGVLKIHSAEECEQRAPQLVSDYLLQQFTPHKFECGVFYVRENGCSKITGINQKHFPSVVGNGADSIRVLAEKHYRFTHHWEIFLQYLDTTRVLDDGEELTLSFIGSHTLGCKFTDDRDFLTSALERKIFEVCDPQPGFNFGRLDVKAKDKAALLAGDFVVIEINGVSSLPTHMFDPRHSVLSGYKIFFEHGRYLARVAREMRHQPMKLLPLKEVLQQVKKNQGELDLVHEVVKSNIH